jgi:hypothetical protein
MHETKALVAEITLQATPRVEKVPAVVKESDLGRRFTGGHQPTQVPEPTLRFGPLALQKVPLGIDPNIYESGQSSSADENQGEGPVRASDKKHQGNQRNQVGYPVRDVPNRA